MNKPDRKENISLRTALFVLLAILGLLFGGSIYYKLPSQIVLLACSILTAGVAYSKGYHKDSVDESGRLIIPVEAIHEMGLDIGDDVFVSFISNDQEANVYRELLIASASLQELDSAPKSIAIPDELMENAGIMPDADIQILSADKVSFLLQHRLR